MARGRKNGGDRRRRQGAAPGDHERHRRREDGNDRAWNQVLESTIGLRVNALGAIAVLLLLVATIYTPIDFILDSPAAVWAACAGVIGSLSSMGATLFVPREAMGGLVTIGLVFIYLLLTRFSGLRLSNSVNAISYPNTIIDVTILSSSFSSCAAHAKIFVL